MQQDRLTATLTTMMARLSDASLSRRDALRIAGTTAAAVGLTGALPNSAIRASAQAASNTLVYGSGQDMSNLDPHTGHDYSIAWGQKALYDSLLRYEGNPGTLQPLVASQVTGDAEGRVWTITLNPAATFAGGAPVDATAVQWNFNRLLEKNLGAAYMFTPIMDASSTTVTDPQTLTVALTTPFGPFDLILPWVFLADPAVVEANAGDDGGESWLLGNSAGGGPYSLSRLEANNLYQFDYRSDYWYSHPTVTTPIQTFIWRIIRESSTKRIAMEAGEIQWGDTLSTEDIKALAADPRFVVNEVPSLAPFSIKLNNQVGPTADVNVRKALAAMFDFDSAIALTEGRGALLSGPLASNLTPWFDESLVPIRYDMEAARSYLAQSAYPDGGFQLEYAYVTGIAIEEQFGLLLLDAASQLNIAINIVPLVWPDIVARVANPETTPAMTAIYSGTDYVDPDNFLFASYHSSQAGSWSAAAHYSNPEVDQMLIDARSSTDPEQRRSLYNQIQQRLVADQVELWVYSEIANAAYDASLTGDVVQSVMGGDLRGVQYAAQ
ncbi:MAG TPA: ABC transporter substrate-binding protein [Thermomicrobiales bacterium]|nr:ABC transporter substrate-binding protein [Thermomicrobiales bacterium]